MMPLSGALILLLSVACADISGSIDVYPHRTDTHSGYNVSTGLLSSAEGVLRLTGEGEGVTLDKLRRRLQCAPSEPDVDESRAVLNFYGLVRMSKELVEVICAWAESECTPWKDCRDRAASFKEGGYESKLRSHIVTSPFQVKLVRIQGGKLRLDWPWGVDRFRKAPLLPGTREMFSTALTLLGKNIRDSVFLVGEERPFLPWNVPFPGFTNSPSKTSGELSMPWAKGWIHTLSRYREFESKGLPFDLFFKHKKAIPWDKKISKAAFFGSLTTVRQVFFSIAAAHPELIDAGWEQPTGGWQDPWNPLSDETQESHLQKFEQLRSQPRANRMRLSNSSAMSMVGYLEPLLPLYLRQRVDYAHKYKYLIILMGLNGHATADRLEYFLRYTDAVILIQESDMVYHYSSRLLPWVHYVPIAHNCADLIEKINWLNENQDMARQIATNAKTFAESYLRLEDYICYVAHALDRLGGLMENTSALEPFNPIDV